MERPEEYQITVKEPLDQRWSEWFGGLSIDRRRSNDGVETTVLHGMVADRSQLYGILARIAQLNLTLLGVRRVGSSEP